MGPPAGSLEETREVAGANLARRTVNLPISVVKIEHFPYRPEPGAANRPGTTPGRRAYGRRQCGPASLVAIRALACRFPAMTSSSICAPRSSGATISPSSAISCACPPCRSAIHQERAAQQNGGELCIPAAHRDGGLLPHRGFLSWCRLLVGGRFRRIECRSARPMGRTTAAPPE
jgi:hypothetical protein